MDTIFQAIILGIIQGLTEFLPISSTAHLIIVPWFFGWTGIVSSLPFDLALHLGTTVAVLGFFWRDWVRLVSAFLKNLPQGFKKIWAETDSRLFVLLAIGCIPAGVAGVLLDKVVENNFRNSILFIAVVMVAFAFVLKWADSRSGKRKMGAITLLDSLVVGFAQVIALIPGVSRSGITITAGLFQGLDRESSTRFSFLLSTPVIAGATLFKFKDILREGGLGNNFSVILFGTLAAALSGLIAIKFLLKFVQSNNFNFFVIYRILVGLGIIVLVLTKVKL